MVISLRETTEKMVTRIIVGAHESNGYWREKLSFIFFFYFLYNSYFEQLK